MNNRFYFLRLLVFLVLLVFIFNPSRKVYQKSRPVLAVALDTSRSFEISGRLAEARKFLRKNLSAWAQKYEVKIYCFGDGVQPIDWSLFNQDKYPIFYRTGIAEALETIRKLNSENLGAIFLITDGQENVDSLDNFPPEIFSQQLGVPVNVAAFAEVVLRDIAIVKLQYPEMTFRNMPARVEAGIRVRGFPPGAIEVWLEKDNKVVQRKTIFSDGRTNYYETEFLLDTSRPGSFNYTLRVAARPKEITEQNNYQKFSFQVIRDQLRILYICGQPGYDYAFRRLVWKNNPGVDLVSFVILRNPENVTLVADKDLSLIPFPAYDVFSKDLENFDLLVIENFDFARFGVPRQHFANVVEWVRRGAGLLLIGGPRAFAGGGYNFTALADILPVQMIEDKEQMISGNFRVKCLDYDFPAFQFSPERKENIQIWENSAELDLTQKLVARPLAGSSVLLIHPSAVINGQPVVVMAVRDFGRGRIAVFGSPVSFRWALAAESPGFYRLFWENLVRYLTHTDSGLIILKDRQPITEGESVNFTIKPLLAVSPGASLEVNWRGPDNTRLTIKPTVQRKGNDFFYQQQFLNKGRYLVQFILREAGKIVGRQDTTIEVVPNYFLEEKNLEVESAWLTRLSNASGGQFYLTPPENPQLSVRAGQQKIIQRQSYIPAEILFGIVIVLLLTEWIWRRLTGLW